MLMAKHCTHYTGLVLYEPLEPKSRKSKRPIYDPIKY